LLGYFEMGLDKRDRAIIKALKNSKKREDRRKDRHQFQDQISQGEFDDIEQKIKFSKRKQKLTIME